MLYQQYFRFCRFAHVSNSFVCGRLLLPWKFSLISKGVVLYIFCQKLRSISDLWEELLYACGHSVFCGYSSMRDLLERAVVKIKELFFNLNKRLLRAKRTWPIPLTKGDEYLHRGKTNKGHKVGIRGWVIHSSCMGMYTFCTRSLQSIITV